MAKRTEAGAVVAGLAAVGVAAVSVALLFSRKAARARVPEATGGVDSAPARTPAELARERRPPARAELSIPLGAPPSDLGAYIDYLWGIESAVLPGLKEEWNRDSLRAATIQAADAYGIPPEIVWGVMWRESGGWNPVGVYAGDPEEAKAAESSAYGMGQILRSRFKSEKKLYPERFPWKHDALIDPLKSIWSIAASYRRGYDKKEKAGGAPVAVTKVPPGSKLLSADVPLWLGQWWAGGWDDPGLPGQYRKQGDIVEHGSNVWLDEGGAINPAALTLPKG